MTTTTAPAKNFRPDEIQRLRALSYEAYLQTRHWKELRRAALARAGHKCTVCSCPNALDVHHNSYARLGCEWLTDLTVLCRACHGLFHDRLALYWRQYG